MYNEIMDLVFDNLKKIVFPEEWLEIDLTLSKHELFILMLVDRRRELIMSQIAEYVNISMSTATGMVDRLVKNGFLIRNRTDTDRRIVMITLTPKSKNVIEEIKKIGTKYIAMFEAVLTDEEEAFLYRITEKLLKVLNTMSANDNEGNAQQSVIEPIKIE